MSVINRWISAGNAQSVHVKDIPVLVVPDFTEAIVEAIKGGARPLHFCGRKTHGGRKITVTAALANCSGEEVLISQTVLELDDCFDSMTMSVPIMNLFERELYEQTGIVPIGHPWLKPVRYEHGRKSGSGNIHEYPYLAFQSEASTHEVAVGPVHAGIIEPGSFRFLCYGEHVYHLEIQLGYQHRGVEKLMLRGDFLGKSNLCESIVGDTTIAHVWAYALLAEALTDTVVTPQVELVRFVALELERVAMHLVGLGGISMDIGYLPGASVYGRIRTTVINTMLRICGNRFGRGLIRPGGVLFNIDNSLRIEIINALDSIYEDLEEINDLFFNLPSVLSRVEGTGIITEQTAREIGLVGIMAKMAGLPVDSRQSHPLGIYKREKIEPHVLTSGNAFARAKIRALEIEQSMRVIRRWLFGETGKAEYEVYNKPAEKLKPNHLAVSLVEGWRGEVSHMVVTDDNSKVLQYKVKDPSFNNWMGLAMAVRENGISDFPLCNKSFEQSYCGFDL